MNRTIICDLDGTIALDEERAEKFLRGPYGKDWDAYFAHCHLDKPNMPVIILLQAMHELNHPIWILSGRSESAKGKTVEWLYKYNVPYDTLIMREIQDRTDDYILKVNRIKNLNVDVLFVLEDRQRVVDAWRAAGYTCFQVAPGNF